MTTHTTVVFLSTDLMFYSQISSAAKAAGLVSCMLKQFDDLDAKTQASSVQWFIVDLSQHQTDLSLLAEKVKAKCPDAHLLGFGAHVETESLRSAQAAGFDDVMPRSKFHNLLPQLFRNSKGD